jgi:hypothetical protein
MLIPVQYHNIAYPRKYTPLIVEVAGHFEITNLKVPVAYRALGYSLHTEFSFGLRNRLKVMSNPLLDGLDIIKASYCDNSKAFALWQREFAEFIGRLTKKHPSPQVIEIHPPFSDYADIDFFLACIQSFNVCLLENNIETRLLLENRTGTKYKNGKFIISTVEDLLALSDKIDSTNTPLGITLDIPQLFRAHQLSPSTINEMHRIFDALITVRHNIEGIHLWGVTTNLKADGKSLQRLTHQGDLNNYFRESTKKKGLKQAFLSRLAELLNDKKHRFFVPELNGFDRNGYTQKCAEQDLASILLDLESASIEVAQQPT